MDMNPIGRIIGGVIAAIALLSITACSRQPSATGLAAKQNDAEAQRKAAEKLAIPVEKALPKSGIVLRLIPAGTFLMGSPESEAQRRAGEQQHKVSVTKAFYLGKYEVTQAQWKKVMGRNPACFTNSGDNAPVENVCWYDCTNFMEKLAALEGMPEGSFRLPSEAEWEYVCRAGTTTAFCYGNHLDSNMANFDGRFPYGRWKKGEYRGRTLSVGQFKPNAWGLYDMHGNVWEWCADRYGEYGGDATDPKGPTEGSRRVVRGGCWMILAADCRSASRSDDSPDFTFYNIGFRLCLPAGQ